jgi:hypothetical protein
MDQDLTDSMRAVLKAEGGVGVGRNHVVYSETEAAVRFKLGEHWYLKPSLDLISTRARKEIDGSVRSATQYTLEGTVDAGIGF